MDKTVRLNKYLSNFGFASRRKVGDLLKNKILTVNGIRVLDKGFRINPEKDDILLDGKKLNPPELVYIMLNKPKGIVSTSKDEKGRTTVVDIINSKVRLYPVGRLDADSKGLILLTNDGDLTNKLTHPKFHIPKTYIALIAGIVDEKKLQNLRNGVVLKDGKTSKSEAKILEQKPERTVVEITIFEGKNRQIRRMCAALKLNLLELKRVSIGPVKLGDLEKGKYRNLTPSEVSALKSFKI